MTNSANVVRTILGRHDWNFPRPYGKPDRGYDHAGFVLDHLRQRSRIIVSVEDAPEEIGGGRWAHASMSHQDRVPDYEEMCLLHAAVWGSEGWSYEVHAPRAEHVNINETVLHLWGREDGAPVLPDFGFRGTI